jgi:hypothetical protein
MLNADVILPYPTTESPFTLVADPPGDGLVEAPPPPRWDACDLPHVSAALSAARSDVARLREKRAEVQVQLDALTRKFAAQSTEIAALDRVVGLLGALMEGGVE